MALFFPLLVLFLVVAGVYFVAITLLTWRVFSPGARRLLIALTLFVIALGIIYAFILQYDPGGFVGWFFHPRSEMAAGAIFSTAQYVGAALLALLIAWRGTWPRPWQRLYWLVLAGLLFFLCLDEFYSLHETVLLWRFLYPVTGVVIIALTLVAFWTGFRQHRYVLVFIVLGLVIMGFGGVGLDAFSNEHRLELRIVNLDWFYCGHEFLGIDCWKYMLLEEIFEMAGVTVVLATLFSFAQTKIEARHRPLLRRALIGGPALWVLWVSVYLWLVPSLETLALPYRLSMTYEDSDLAMLGYTVSREVAAPGDAVDVTVYFRANDWLDEAYSFSIHALTHPDVESVAQSDTPLGGWEYPSTAWVPGLATRSHLHLVIPQDIPDLPLSYWFMARVWTWRSDPVDEAYTDYQVGTVVAEGDRPRLTPDTIILFSLPVVGGDPAPEPPQPVAYHFEGGFTLAGVDVPAQAVLGGELPLAVWWQTEADPTVAVDLTQFVHLFHSNGEDFFVYDRQPFDGRFPTADWPANTAMVDRFSITLPADLPPGEYCVQIGMYEPDAYDRIPVTDADGQPVVDYSIVLGTVTVTR